MWNQDVEGLLVLLKLFPAKKGREPFLKATQKLLVFRPVNYIINISDKQCKCVFFRMEPRLMS